MLMELLKKDLERWYYYAGYRERKASSAEVLLKAFSPRFLPVVLSRLAHSLHCGKLTVLSRFVSLLNFLFFGVELAARCEIGPGLCFAHTYGIVIGARKIGSNALIYHEVTIGAKEMDIGYNPDMRPLIGDNVVIGAGAKVLGGITIGDNSVIGANAVVTRDIPANVVVGGIPAKVIKQRTAK